jgi:PAS domain S-box-containing protein
MRQPKAELFQLMAQSVRDYAIFLLDEHGVIMSWNKGAELLKQYTPAEIIGRHFSIFYQPEDIARDWPAQELAVATREGRIEDEGWRIRKDGSRFWASVSITALREPGGKLLGFSKITRDLSLRRDAEERLRQSEERFRLLVDGVQDYAIYMLNVEGLVTSWNAGARKIKGYESDEIIGRHFSVFYPREDIDAGRPWIELALAREQGRAEDEGWRVRKDGSKFWARVVVTALRDEHDRLRGFAKVTQDLTQRRHSESLEVAARNINDFIAVLAHELRNPLAPIRTAAQVMRGGGPADATQEQMLKIIERQSAQLGRIVEDLLDISRVTRGIFSVVTRVMPLTEIVDQALETARPLIEAAKHRLRVEMPVQTLLVSADAARMTQALTNLLNNAARYTEPGGEITLTVEATNGATPQVAIRVRDTGRGIEARLLDSIFSMFVQARTALGEPGAGLGVGLALARAIVEMHHGTLQARSDGPGKGSEFTIRMPLAVEQRAPAAKPAAAGLPATRPPARGQGHRILVVDDNVDAAVTLSNLLEFYGHDVRTVYNGHEALSACDTFLPDIVLLDIGMPGMSGYEVARTLRERGLKPQPFIVAVTGWGKAEDKKRALESGFDVHLTKPLEAHQLLQILESRPATLQ